MTEGLISRLFGGRPILEARGDGWESRVVLNPAADLIRVQDTSDIPASWGLTAEQSERLSNSGGAVAMLYRAQGALKPGEDVAPSSLGLALFTAEFELVKRWDAPVIRPEGEFQNLGVEDGRITRIGDTWHLYYTGYSGNPKEGQWDDRRIRICHAHSSDLVSWTLEGPISGTLNDVPNKNAVLLNEPLPTGEYVLLHRPMEGPNAMSICFAISDSPSGPWSDQGVLMHGINRPECSRSWIGAGGPPLHLDGGKYLMIYHRGSFDHDEKREYDLGAALLDFSSHRLRSGSSLVVSRIEPIMRPTGPGEQVGDPEVGVDNVVFTCANFVLDDDLFIPYAGADSRIFVASARLSELLAVLGDSTQN